MEDKKQNNTRLLIGIGAVVGLLVLFFVLWWLMRGEDGPEPPTQESTNTVVVSEPVVEEPVPAVVEEEAVVIEPVQETEVAPEVVTEVVPTELEEEEVVPSLEQYDQTVLVFTSGDGKLKGTAGLTYDAYTEKLDAVFNLYISDPWAKVGSGYTYTGKIQNTKGTLSVPASFTNTRYCNVDAIGNPFGHYYEDAYRCGKYGDSQKFFVTFGGEFDSYKQLTSVNKLYIYPVGSFGGNPDESIKGVEPAYTYSFDFDKTTKKKYADHPFLQ